MNTKTQRELITMLKAVESACKHCANSLADGHDDKKPWEVCGFSVDVDNDRFLHCNHPGRSGDYCVREYEIKPHRTVNHTNSDQCPNN